MSETQTPPADSTPPQAPPPWWTAAQPKKRSALSKVLIYIGVLALVISIVCNAYLMAIIGLMAGSPMRTATLRDGKEDQIVAVYQVGGLIMGSSASDFGRFYRIVRDTPEIKAVVLRVDSPGGTVAASDEIHMMVKKIREDLKRPVVVSMGAVAASGGYYVAAPADAIYAEPTTITASIGVIMQVPVAADWMKEHGINMVVVRSKQAQRHKAAINYFENPDIETLQKQQVLLDEMHDRFVAVVKDGRGDKIKTTPTKVTVKDFDGKDIVRDQTFPFNGEVVLAEKAKAIGLVDEIGYLDDAANAAAKLAKLDNPKLVQYSQTRGLLLGLFFSSEEEIPTFDTKMLDRFLSPKPMMIWEGR